MARIIHSVEEELKDTLLSSFRQAEPEEIGGLPQSSFVWVKLSTMEQVILAQQKDKRIFIREFIKNEVLRRSYYILIPSEEAIRCAL